MGSSVRATIRFDGPNLSGHAIPADSLVSSIAALSSLIQDANRIFNGEDSKAKLIINADVKQNCFEIGIGIALTVAQKVAGFFGVSQYSDPVLLLCWLGIVIPLDAQQRMTSFYQLLKIMKGKDLPEKGTPIPFDKREPVQLNIHVEGDGNAISPIVVSGGVLELYRDRKARRAAAQAVAPDSDRAYDKVGFYDAGRLAASFDHDEAEEIIANIPGDDPDGESIVFSTIQTTVRVKKPDLQGDSKWVFIWKGKSLSASIADEEWISRVKNAEIALTSASRMEVTMREATTIDSSGKASRSDYQITKVMKLLPKEDNKEIAFGGSVE